MKPAHTSGAAIALAAALLILAVDAPMGVVSAGGARGKCIGANSCKGKSDCGGKNGFPGQNGLQGQRLSRADQGRMQQDPGDQIHAVGKRDSPATGLGTANPATSCSCKLFASKIHTACGGPSGAAFFRAFGFLSRIERSVC